MDTLNKRPIGKWQATVPQSATFSKCTDAMKWARETELQAEQGMLQHTGSYVGTKMSFVSGITRHGVPMLIVRVACIG